MNVFLFPGQGSQEIGMAADLFKADAPFRELVRRASERTGSDLEKICLRGPERELTRTKNLQPLLVCVSLGYLRHLTDKGIRPDKVLGHSLGEISALAAAGCVSFETAVDIAAKRGELMDAAATRVSGGMAAVIAPERKKVLHLLAQHFSSAQLVLANDNAPNQIVVSGEIAALERFTALVASEKLGQCRRLAVAGPWHSPLMAPAQQEFSGWLETIEFHPPKVPLIFNVTAAVETDPQKIRQLRGARSRRAGSLADGDGFAARRGEAGIVRGRAGTRVVRAGAGERFWRRDEEFATSTICAALKWPRGLS